MNIFMVTTTTEVDLSYKSSWSGLYSSIEHHVDIFKFLEG